MLSNAYFLAKFRFGTAENEPAKNLQNFANLPILEGDLATRLLRDPRVHDRRHRRGPLLRVQGHERLDEVLRLVAEVRLAEHALDAHPWQRRAHHLGGE